MPRRRFTAPLNAPGNESKGILMPKTLPFMVGTVQVNGSGSLFTESVVYLCLVNLFHADWYYPILDTCTVCILLTFGLVPCSYSTPCYAFSAAQLYATGYNTSLLHSASIALTNSLKQLASGHCQDNTCHFYMMPSMLAYHTLKDHIRNEARHRLFSSMFASQCFFVEPAERMGIISFVCRSI